MRIVCICGSPRKNGNTTKILNEFVRAFHQNGFCVSQYFISDLNVEYCCGHKYCELDGSCIKNDDVKRVIDDIATADMVIVASPSYWGDVTGQFKVFIDRCTPYGNLNPSRKYQPNGAKGIAIAVRAGQNKKENEHLVATIEHFLGHLDIPLLSSFTVEGIDKLSDLEERPEILARAFEFAKTIGKSDPIIEGE